jgi:hypothetical protein
VSFGVKRLRAGDFCPSTVAKARKQGGLQAMLAKSKTEPLGPSSGDFGLDLMDLMKSD